MFKADDVVYWMRRIGVVLMKEAILTAITSALGDESAQRLADVTAQGPCVVLPAPSP
jgi:hypothetical protein